MALNQSLGYLQGVPVNSSDETIDSLKFVHEIASQNREIVEVEDKKFVLSKYAQSVVDIEALLEPYRDGPRRIKAAPQFITVESFAEYIQKFNSDTRTEKSATDVFVHGSIDKATVTATLDYHTTVSPAWCDHTATLVSKRTPEWIEMKAASGVHKSQKDFADFIDKWGAWVIDPIPTELIKIIEDLDGHTGGTWGSKVVRQNGSYRFSHTEETVTNIEVPTKFVVQVQPFYSSEPVKVDVKLQYKITKDNGVTFALILDNPLHVEYKCLMETFSAVESAIGTSVLVGP